MSLTTLSLGRNVPFRSVNLPKGNPFLSLRAIPLLIVLAGFWLSAPVLWAQVTVTLPYTISVFAQGTSSYLNPDSITQLNNNIFVGFQNITARDGSDHKTSTIVQYTLDGKVVATFSVLGHNDGLGVVSSLVWCLQNEDANPNLTVIDPVTGVETPYTFPTPPHGGGYDDIAVHKGEVYLSASNPNLNSAGVNVFPALVRATLVGTMVVTTPILNGDATAIDFVTGDPVTLDLTDPDSLRVDPRGRIVLNSQADGELIFVEHPGGNGNAQHVGRLSLSDQVDDIAFAPHSNGAFLLFCDTSTNTIYRIDRPPFGFAAGTAYVTAPSDSVPTPSIVGEVNLNTGQLTPIVTGLGSPHGTIFVRP